MSSILVEEDLGIYSIYVDGSPAYAHENDVHIAFIDRHMPLNATSAVKGQFNDFSKVAYGDITKEIVQKADRVSHKLQSIFVFTNLLEFAVKEITVTAIPNKT